MNTHDPDGAAAGAPCDDVKVLLSGLIDRELDPADELRVATHLAACEACRAEARRLEGMSRGLRFAGRAATPPAAGWEGIARALEARRGAGAMLFRSSARLAAAAAVVIVLAAIAGGAFLLRSTGPRPVELTIADRVSPELLDQLIGPTHGLDFSSLGPARAVERGQLSREIQRASFTPIAPASLPNGYVFDGAWVISCDTCRMVCLRYRRDGKFLAVLQGPSGGKAICSLANPQCCLLGGMACRRWRGGRVEVVQTTRGSLALMLAVPAGDADVDAVMASLANPPADKGNGLHAD